MSIVLELKKFKFFLLIHGSCGGSLISSESDCCKLIKLNWSFSLSGSLCSLTKLTLCTSNTIGYANAFAICTMSTSISTCVANRIIITHFVVRIATPSFDVTFKQCYIVLFYILIQWHIGQVQEYCKLQFLIFSSNIFFQIHLEIQSFKILQSGSHIQWDFAE